MKVCWLVVVVFFFVYYLLKKRNPKKRCSFDRDYEWERSSLTAKKSEAFNGKRPGRRRLSDGDVDWRRSAWGAPKFSSKVAGTVNSGTGGAPAGWTRIGRRTGPRSRLGRRNGVSSSRNGIFNRSTGGGVGVGVGGGADKSKFPNLAATMATTVAVAPVRRRRRSFARKNGWTHVL